jgi:hypothetical protein
MLVIAMIRSPRHGDDNGKALAAVRNPSTTYFVKAFFDKHGEYSACKHFPWLGVVSISFKTAC